MERGKIISLRTEALAATAASLLIAATLPPSEGQAAQPRAEATYAPTAAYLPEVTRIAQPRVNRVR